MKTSLIMLRRRRARSCDFSLASMALRPPVSPGSHPGSKVAIKTLHCGYDTRNRDFLEAHITNESDVREVTDLSRSGRMTRQVVTSKSRITVRSFSFLPSSQEQSEEFFLRCSDYCSSGRAPIQIHTMKIHFTSSLHTHTK